MKSQSESLFENHVGILARGLESLPPLPRIIQYEDDYHEKIRTIDVEKSLSEMKIWSAGRVENLNFQLFDHRIQGLMRSFLLNTIIDSAPGSVHYYYRNLRKVPSETIELLAASTLRVVQLKWTALVDQLNAEGQNSLKKLLQFLCDSNFLQWRPHFKDSISNLPTPTRDPYATVRAGDCFLSISEEASIVKWIDRMSKASENMSRFSLEMTALVICSYQFGMRPVQLGTLRKRDCSIRWSSEDGSPIVHLTFRLAKQRNLIASRLPLVRKVKREWAPIFVGLMNELRDESSTKFIFGFNNRADLSYMLNAQLSEILPDSNRMAYDLRHSLAQRMVDAGASHEELASALGHTHLKTGLVYFRASANQAELVNKALGLSETYLAVAKIASDRFISTEALSRLKGEQQVAGVPHGIPIAGIGGCETGQSSCPYNPITACYGCPKFMPVKDIALHEQVLKDFRGVVNLYKRSGAGDQESPAYLQLRRTIADVQGVINQMETDIAP